MRILHLGKYYAPERGGIESYLRALSEWCVARGHAVGQAPTPGKPQLPAPRAGSAESVAEVVARFGGRRDAAADYLGISRTTLWRRLREESGG